MKKISVLIFLLLATAAFILIWLYQVEKQQVEVVTQITFTHDTTEPKPQVDPCLELGMPEGSYVFADGVCTVNEEYIEKANSLANQESNEGDKTENVFITEVTEKEGKIYISADHIDFPECNQQTEGTVKKPV